MRANPSNDLTKAIAAQGSSGSVKGEKYRVWMDGFWYDGSYYPQGVWFFQKGSAPRVGPFPTSRLAEKYLHSSRAVTDAYLRRTGVLKENPRQRGSWAHKAVNYRIVYPRGANGWRGWSPTVAEVELKKARQRDRNAFLQFWNSDIPEDPHYGYWHTVPDQGLIPPPVFSYANPLPGSPWLWVAGAAIAVGVGWWYVKGRNLELFPHVAKQGCAIDAFGSWLSEWAKPKEKEVVYLPKRTTPPTQEEAQQSAWSQVFSSDPSRLIIVLGDGSFWQYENGKAVSAPALRDDYCKFKPTTKQLGHPVQTFLP